MAQSYTVIAQTPTVQVLSPTQVIDAQIVEFVTHPSGVSAQRVVPLAQWEAGDAAGWIQPLADAIEGMISGGLASYASWVQQIDPATGLLADAIAFVVTYDPGDGRPIQEAIATIPVAALTLDTQFGGVLASYFGGGSSTLDPVQAVRDVYDQLVATTNL
jgi:hypothetical protein